MSYNYSHYSTYFIYTYIIDNRPIELTPNLTAAMHVYLQDKQKIEHPSQPHVENAGHSHTNNSIENVDVGEDTSSSNIRVYARKLKKRRKFLINTDDDGNTDEDTNKNPNLNG